MTYDWWTLEYQYNWDVQVHNDVWPYLKSWFTNLLLIFYIDK